MSVETGVTIILVVVTLVTVVIEVTITVTVLLNVFSSCPCGDSRDYGYRGDGVTTSDFSCDCCACGNCCDREFDSR